MIQELNNYWVVVDENDMPQDYTIDKFASLSKAAFKLFNKGEFSDYEAIGYRCLQVNIKMEEVK